MSEVTRAQWVNGSSLGWMLRQVASTCNNQVKERRFKESALSHSEEVTGMNHIHFGGIDRQEIYHAARPFFYRGDKYRHLRARTLRSGGKCFFLVPFYIHSTEDKTNSPTTIKSLFIWATLWVFPRTETAETVVLLNQTRQKRQGFVRALVFTRQFRRAKAESS